jgi:hypothetical protein
MVTLVTLVIILFPIHHGHPIISFATLLIMGYYLLVCRPVRQAFVEYLINF